MRAPASEKTQRIVVVDDEEGLLFLMTEGLQREGYQVEGFETGMAAFKWLQSKPADLLLLDLKMVDLPATSLVQRLRDQGREFPFIIVTGHGDERTAVEVMKQGALDYVMKESGMLDLLPGIVRRAFGVIERDRKLAQANADVRRREERHQKIIQTALDGFARFDRDLRLLEVNRAMCDMLGFAPAAGGSCDLRQIEETVLTEEVRTRTKVVAREGVGHFFTRWKRQDGSVIEVEVSMRADDGEFFGFVHDLSEHRRLEREALQSSFDERSRIGRELHDGVGQQLTAIEMMSHALARQLKGGEPGLAKAANEIARYTRQAISHTRQLAHGLAPMTLQAEGLMGALDELAHMTAATGVQCDFQCPVPVLVHDPATATHLHRIAQEAVNNALKHAKATRIDIELTQQDDRVVLIIEDNGRGLSAASKKKPGLGLELLHYRARLIGGHLDIESRRGKGVRIVCTLSSPS